MTPDELVIIADKSTSMTTVLEECGYSIWKKPLQIACPIHKLGGESRPSARIYDDDRVVWCFYCVVQYCVTEVWAAQKAVDRPTAAREILARWPVSEEDAKAVLRRAKVPYRPPVTEVYLGSLERHLVTHRGVAEFERYRKWAQAIDEFVVFISTIPDENQEIAILSFIDRMESNLSEKI